jgi:hypothetical protein
MSDNQFAMLFWVLLFIAAELFIIGGFYMRSESVGAWERIWVHWREQKESYLSKISFDLHPISELLDDIVRELSRPRLERETAARESRAAAVAKPEANRDKPLR